MRHFPDLRATKTCNTPAAACRQEYLYCILGFGRPLAGFPGVGCYDLGIDRRYVLCITLDSSNVFIVFFCLVYFAN